MGNSDVSIIPFIDQGYERLVELAQTTYAGREISDPEYLNWEYVKNPVGTAIVFVAESGEKIVSQYLVLPQHYVLNGQIIIGSLSVNTLTSPSWRGKGLFPALAGETFKRCSEAEINFTIGFPNPVSSPVIRKNKLFHHIGALSLLVMLIRPFNIPFTMIKNRKKKSGEEIGLKIIPNELSEIDEISELILKNDVLQFESLVKKFNKRIHLTTHRSIEYFRWRYFSVPIREYKILKIIRNGVIESVFVIHSKYIYGLRVLILVDIISADAKSINTISQALKKIAQRNKIDIIISALPKHSDEYGVMRAHKFFRPSRFFLPQQLHMIARKNTERCPDEILDFKNWFITFGDYDIF